jgi:chitinase
MKPKIILVLLIFGFIFFHAHSQNPKSDFKIVGYYSLKSAMLNSYAFPFKQITHVNLWFLNPDTVGNFNYDLTSLKPFLKKAHRKKVKVFFSIGGGGEHPYYHNLLKPGNRFALVQSFLSLAVQNDIDGIDVDLEGNDIDENYEPFVCELAQALKANNKMMSSAIAVYYKDQLSDKALAQYDFVNIMSYDRTGPWQPDKPGQHSSYNDAQEDLEYFGKERNLPKEKMVLGVPFYGYGFGPDTSTLPMTMNYKTIVASFHGSENSDEWKMANGMIMYYNGIPTIRLKTALSMEKASGIMIWQVEGDAKGRKSLLREIYRSARQNKKKL